MDKMTFGILLELFVLCAVCLLEVNSRRLACYPSLGQPKPCNCQLKTTRPTVICRAKKIKEVVSGIPESSVVLDLSYNSITEIKQNDFIRLERLQTLLLLSNHIERIHPRAFRNLYNLNLLVLERNRLTSIPEQLFQHLPSLVNINLQRNNISSISRRAFVTLPITSARTVTVALNENPISCGCEEKALKQWMKDTPRRLFLNSARCHNTTSKLEIIQTPESEFPDCPPPQLQVIPTNTSCYTCTNAVNHQQCRETGHLKQCDHSKMVCSSRISNRGKTFSINKGCMWYESCLNLERANVRECGLYNQLNRQCNYCCVGENCNVDEIGGRTKEYTFALAFVINSTYNQDLENYESQLFGSLHRSVMIGLENAMNSIDGGYTVTINNFSPPKISVYAIIYSTNLNTYTESAVISLLNETLKNDATSGGLLELGVIPSTIHINIFGQERNVCPEEVISTRYGIFTWPQTRVGDTVLQPCPNQLLHFARRKCNWSESGSSVWLDPEIRNCGINSTNQLNTLLHSDITAANVQAALNQLQDLTKDSRNFNKEQLSLAVKVLKKILDEESSYTNQQVMNGSVAVVSQLIYSSDDVLKEAEKEFKTSTSLLQSIDKIGNKVSLADGNVTIVQPNVVLAAVPVDDQNFRGLSLSARTRAKAGRVSGFTLLDDDDLIEENDDDDETVEADDRDDTEGYRKQDTTERPDSPKDTTERIDDPRDTTERTDDGDEYNIREGNGLVTATNIKDTTERTNDVPDTTERDDDQGVEREDDDDDDDDDDFDKRDKGSRNLPEMNDDSDDYENVNSFVLPSTLFSRLTKAEKQVVERVAFHVFPTSKLFSSMNDPEVGLNIFENPRNKLIITKVNSGIIAASIPQVSITNLSDPVTMRFAHTSKNSTNPRCVFWHDGRDGSPERWSSEGCRVVANVQGSFTTCACDHLTNFALLMDVYQDGYAISKTDQKVLSVISFIGCSLSFICLVFTLITYLLFKKLRKDNPSKILVNLCVALALSNLIFIVGMHSYAMENAIGCKTVAVLLHYFLLAALFWMAVEAFYMYLALVLVFKTYYSNFMLKCCIVGWGLPFLIVVITLSVNNTDNYSNLDSGLCWLMPTPFYGAFAGPVLFVLLINFIAFALVLRQLCGLQAQKLTKSDRSDRLSKLRGAVGVVILLGLTWVFAIFAVGPVRTVFSYLFAIFNALQGLFIFVFYCLFKRDAINSWRRLLPCCEVIDEKSSSRGFSATSPATITGNQNVNKNNTSTKKRSSQNRYVVGNETTSRIGDWYDSHSGSNTSSSYI